MKREDQWNYEQLIKENEELTRKLNREDWSLICPKCKSDEDVSYDLFYTENDIPYNGAYCHECNLMVWEDEHE